MLQLARRQAVGNANPLTLNEMARQEGLTIPHVAKIIRRLRKAGLVRSVLGRTGGYSLARQADAINVAEIMAALGGKLYDIDYCKKYPGDLAVCSHMGDCSIRSLWGVLETLLERVLSQTWLSDLIRSEQGMAAVLGSRVPAELPRAARGCS
jgi:Rrf2 family protein